MRQPSCSPKNVTLLPTTGPEIEQQRAGLALQAGEELVQRLGRIDDASATFVTDASAAAPASASRARPEHPEKVGQRTSGVGHVTRWLGADPLALLRVRWFGCRPSGRLRLARLRSAAGFGCCCGCCACCPARCMSTLPRKCAPSAMATRGEAMSPSTEPLSRMSTFSDAVTLPVTSPSTTTALANTSALILPFGPMVRTLSLQIDPAFDVALDREIFAAAQLALDDDRLADIHVVPPNLRHAARPPPAQRQQAPRAQPPE